MVPHDRDIFAEFTVQSYLVFLDCSIILQLHYEVCITLWNMEKSSGGYVFRILHLCNVAWCKSLNEFKDFNHNKETNKKIKEQSRGYLSQSGLPLRGFL
jgi:hypothetical protein